MNEQKEWNIRDWLFNDRLSKNEQRTASFMVKKLQSIALGQFDTVVDELPCQYQCCEEIIWANRGCMIWESEIGWVCTQYSVKGYDLNGRPNLFKPVIAQAQDDEKRIILDTPTLTSEECQIFQDRTSYGSGRRDALMLVPDYCDVTETIRQQVFNQKTPMIGVAGNQKTKRKLQNAFVSISNNVKALFLDTDIRDDMKPLDFNAPYNVDSLQIYRKQLETMMLEFMGIDNREPTVKKQQTQVDEIEGNDELLNYTLADCLEARNRGVERCKNLGLHAHTQIREIVRPIMIEEDGIDADKTDNSRIQTQERGRSPLQDDKVSRCSFRIPFRRSELGYPLTGGRMDPDPEGSPQQILR